MVKAAAMVAATPRGMGVIILRYMAPVCKYEPVCNGGEREAHLCATNSMSEIQKMYTP